MSGVTTLNDFIQERQEAFPYATGELSALLRDIELASKIVNSQVNKAGLVNILGAVGSENVQGEEQQKLDVFANEQFIKAFKNGVDLNKLDILSENIEETTVSVTFRYGIKG